MTDGVGLAILALSALVACHDEAAAEFGELLRLFLNSGLLQGNVRLAYSVRPEGKAREQFRQRYHRLAQRYKGDLKTTPGIVFWLLVRALPVRSLARVASLFKSSILRIERHKPWVRELQQFNAKCLNGSPNGLEAACTMMTAACFPKGVTDADQAIQSNAVLRALVSPGDWAKPRKTAARQAVKRGRKTLALDGYAKVKTSTLQEGARRWAIIQVKYEGSLADAIRSREFGLVSEPNLSAEIGPFDRALGIKRRRGRPPSHETEQPDQVKRKDEVRNAPTQRRPWFRRET